MILFSDQSNMGICCSVFQLFNKLRASTFIMQRERDSMNEKNNSPFTFSCKTYEYQGIHYKSDSDSTILNLAKNVIAHENQFLQNCTCDEKMLVQEPCANNATSSKKITKIQKTTYFGEGIRSYDKRQMTKVQNEARRKILNPKYYARTKKKNYINDQPMDVVNTNNRFQCSPGCFPNITHEWHEKSSSQELVENDSAKFRQIALNISFSDKIKFHKATCQKLKCACRVLNDKQLKALQDKILSGDTLLGKAFPFLDKQELLT